MTALAWAGVAVGIVVLAQFAYDSRPFPGEDWTGYPDGMPPPGPADQAGQVRIEE